MLEISILRKGTTLLSDEGYSQPMASKFGAHPGMPKCNGSMGLSASAHGLWDLGELRSLTERDSSFPHPTPGAVPLIPMCL